MGREREDTSDLIRKMEKEGLFRGEEGGEFRRRREEIKSNSRVQWWENWERGFLGREEGDKYRRMGEEGKITVKVSE